MIEVDGYGPCHLIGRGGVGEVYASTQLSTGARVAIKILRDVTDESAAWRRSRRELAAMVALAGHAHVIRLIEVIDLATGPALVMEYAPGGSVGELVEARGQLTAAETVFVGLHAATALVAAHGRGIVHRDVKPHNLLIDTYGQVKLCDFGIAALVRSDEFRAQTHAVSLRYASPEDLEGDVHAGPASDVYSLGATLVHCRFGAPPSLRDRVTGWRLTDARSGTELDELLVACLRIDPTLRPSAAELCESLDQLSIPGERCRALVGIRGDTEPVDEVAPAMPPPVTHDPTVARPSSIAAALGGGPAAPTAAPTADPIAARSRADAPAPRHTASARTANSADTPGRRLSPVTLGIGAVTLVVLAAITGWWATRSPDDNVDAKREPVVSVAATTLAASAPIGFAERPVGLSDLTAAVWPAGPDGECLTQQPDSNELVAVDCTAAHDLQRLGSGTLPTDTAIEAIVDRVAQRCTAWWATARAASALPVEIEAAMRVSHTTASTEAWAAGDREFQCYVGVPNRRLTGSALVTNA